MIQERLHIDELKRIEKQVNTLVRSWQKLVKNHTQLEEKYAILTEEMRKLKSHHQAEIAGMEQSQNDAAEAAKSALEAAVAAKESHWLQKYDAAIAAHDAQLCEINAAHQNELAELQQEMVRKEQALTDELKQVKKIKEALSNRVLGVTE